MAAIDWESRIRQAMDAYNRGDSRAALAHASDDIELQRIDISPESRNPIRGRTQVLEFFRPDVFEDQRSDLVELIQGDKAIITRIRFSARSAGSGLAIPPLESFIVWRIEGDAIARIEFMRTATKPGARRGSGAARSLYVRLRPYWRS